MSLFSQSITGVFEKKGLEKLNPFSALIVRYLFGVVLLFLFIPFFTDFVFPSIDFIPYILFTTLIGSAAVIFYYKAVKETKVSLVTAITKNYFLVTIIFSFLFLQETLSLIQIFAVILIVFALLLLSFEKNKLKFKIEKGVLYSFLTFIGWGAYFAMIKPIVLILNPFNTTLITETMIFFMILIYSLSTKKEINLSETKSNLFLLTGTVFLTIGLVAYYISIELIGASLSAVVIATSPLITAMLARIFLKEKLVLRQYFALLLSVTGIILLFL